MCIRATELVPTDAFTSEWRDPAAAHDGDLHTEEDNDAFASIHRCQAWQRP